MAKLTYKIAGVDIDAGNAFVELIKPLAKKTYKSNVIGKIGDFSGSYVFPIDKYRKPVLVASADGVGTKLKIAIMAQTLDTIGLDLVAMNVNDLVTCGAEPLFFLDYLATSKLNPKHGVEIIKGVVKGCKEAGCVLLGGETAEMPGFYKKGDFDLAGFAVGVVENDKRIDGSRVRPGDVLIGLSSNGLHSNGYSLARKILFEKKKFKLTDRISPLKNTIGDELLKPTRIYVKTILNLKNNFDIHAIAHITGGGLVENIPRVIPRNCEVVIDSTLWELPPVFYLIKLYSGIEKDEMFRTFNCGIGMALVVSKVDADKILGRINKLKEKAMIIGEVVRKKRGKPAVVIT
ncbi:MAG: phosphoribosylformylglycinamidine cyclo-ligase [Thermodesulfobacteriota bacterium]